MSDAWSLGVLAGGRSRRMGRDKATLTVGGRTLLEHVVAALEGGGPEEILVGDREQGEPFGNAWRRVPDMEPGAGPLASLVALLEACRSPWLLAVPCDMPCLPGDLAERMIAGAGAARAVVFEALGRVQPFPVLLCRELGLELADVFRSGERTALGWRSVDPGRVLPWDALYPELTAEQAFLNVNRPSDLERLEAPEQASLRVAGAGGRCYPPAPLQEAPGACLRGRSVADPRAGREGVASRFRLMSRSPLLEDLYRDIRSPLGDVDDEIRACLATSRDALAEMLTHLAGYAGKRLRPALVLITARAAGGGPVDQRLTRLAAVVELIHLATLVHDDVIDEADLRRRQPTVNSRWSNYDAVLLGDIVFARAIGLLARLGDQRALQTLTEAVSTLCEGEILQNRHRHDVQLAEEAYYGIIEAKTAALYGAGCELAGYFAGAPADAVQAFRTFGIELGKAFQITDDCLDLTGIEAEVGKSLGTDLRLGKMTLPLIFLREEGSVDEVALIQRVVTAAEPDAEDLVLLQNLLRRSDVCGRALTRAREHAAAALAAVMPFASGEPLASLEAVAAFVFERRS